MVPETLSEAALLDALTTGVVVGTPETEILALSAQTKSELDAIVARGWGQKRKFRALRTYLFDEVGRNIEYEATATLTAEQAYQAGEGNCLALSNLFIASARHIGLNARFQTVTVKPTWDQEGSTMIRYEHIVAFGELGHREDYVIDFLPTFSMENRLSEQINDQQALALYHNNLGAEAILFGDYELAVKQMLKAIKLWPENSDAWNNLGVAYRRQGKDQLSELTYKRALRLDDNNYSALTNLTQLYLSTGRRPDAERFLARVNHYYRRNPFFNYYLARLHYEAAEYLQAIEYLDVAILLEGDEPDFYAALSESYLQIGDAENSERAKRLAEVARNKMYANQSTEESNLVRGVLWMKL
jgi:Flp pilus assembly protein TadD